jgi:hypothetical protein
LYVSNVLDHDNGRFADAGPGAGSTPSTKQLDDLYHKSGLAVLVEQIPAGVQAGFDKAFNGDQSRSLTAQQLRMIHTRIPQAYTPDNIRPGIITVLAEALSAEPERR